MAVFPCPSIQPAAVGTINYPVTKKIVVKAGGTLQMAIDDAVGEACDKAQTDGTAAMVNDGCAGGCVCVKFIIPAIWNVATAWVPGKAGKQVAITVTGMWTGYVLCVHIEGGAGKEHEPEPEPGKGEHERKEKDKSERKRKDKSRGRSGKARKD